MVSPLCIAQDTPLGQSLGVGNVSLLLEGSPSATQPILGYHLLKGPVPASSFVPGAHIPTSDVVKTLTASDIMLSLNVTSTGQVELV